MMKLQRERDHKVAIQNTYVLPDRIEILRRLATQDLYSGPLSNDDESANYHGEGGFTYPGFANACRELAAWADENVPCSLYYDADADCLSESVPGPWQDEDGNWNEPEPVREVRQTEICEALFGRQLAQYL